MRASSLLFVFIGVLFPVGHVASAVGDAPFSIVITGPQRPVKGGSEVKVKIILKNTSDREITIARTNAVSQAECHFLIEVRDVHGQSAPDTDFGRGIMGRETKKRVILYWGDAFFTLKPNETLEDEAVVTKLYDLSRPGKYFIQATRQFPEQLGKGQVKSNTIEITVTE